MPLDLGTDRQGQATSLPQGWIHADIGAVGAAGNATFDGTTFRITGSGVDITVTDYGLGSGGSVPGSLHPALRGSTGADPSVPVPR